MEPKVNPPGEGQSRKASIRRMLSHFNATHAPAPVLKHEEPPLEVIPVPDPVTEVVKAKKARQKKKVVLKSKPKKIGPKIVKLADDRKLPTQKKKAVILVKKYKFTKTVRSPL